MKQFQDLNYLLQQVKEKQELYLNTITGFEFEPITLVKEKQELYLNRR